MPPTYLENLSAFTHFLTAYTHTLLYLRTLYPRTSFVQSRFHNTAVYQSRHPLVCEWIRDAVTAVRTELLAGTVSRIGIVIFSYGNGNGNGGTGGEGEGVRQDRATGSAKIMERYMFDVSAFPIVDKSERNMEMAWQSSNSASNSKLNSDNDDDDDDDDNDLENMPIDRRKKSKQAPLDADTDINLSEQFRAALISLTTRTSRLSPLSPNCSFNISMELRDEADIDPPIGHPQPWIPVQPSLQKTGRKGAQKEDTHPEEGKGDSKAKSREGQDLGGVKVTPIRTVEAGVFRFETWVEEGKAKFEESQNPSEETSFASSWG